MNYTTRTIALLSELLHPPLPSDPASVQKVHNKMFEEGHPDYTSFAVIPNGAVLSNPGTRPGEVSQVSFLPDRFQFREELGHLTHEEFGTRIQRIATNLCALRQIRGFAAQSVVVRTLVNPKAFKDSRNFLRNGMFGFGDKMDVFGVAPQLYGLRMVFPPTEESPTAFSLRIESFNNDVRSLYIESQGTFGPIDVSNGLDALAENVNETFRFIVERGLPFVSQFDIRQEA
jgi:hypothetical protein